MRHNEDVLNGELSKKLPWAVGTDELDSPHAKAHLLLQASLDPRSPVEDSEPGGPKLDTTNAFFMGVSEHALRICQFAGENEPGCETWSPLPNHRVGISPRPELLLSTSQSGGPSLLSLLGMLTWTLGKEPS